MYSNFVFLDQFLFELSCKNTHTHTNTHTHRDSNEYPIVAFITTTVQTSTEISQNDLARIHRVNL